MAGKTHQERDDFEDRFFDQQERRFDTMERKLDKNTQISQKALTEAQLTNSRVTHLEDNVRINLNEAHKISNKALTRANRVNGRLVDLEQVLLPDKKPEKENLPKWYKDDKLIKIIVYILAATILTILGWKSALQELLK